MIKVEVLQTIDEIEQESIDSLSDDSFFTYGWFKTLETSKPFKIVPKYFVVYDDDEILAIAPSFIQFNSQYFTLEDLFPLVKRIRNLINRIGFYLAPPLICYSPSSFHSKVLFKKNCDEKAILELISKKIDQICKKHRILFSSFFFVSEFDRFLIRNLPDFGYAKIPLMRTLYLDISWSNFDEYLSSLKYKVRSTIRREIKKNRNYGVIIEKMNSYDSLSSKLSVLYSNLYLKYRAKKSPLHPLFFEKLSKYAKDKTRLFTAKKDGKIIGFTLGLVHKNIYDGYIAGFDYNYLTKTDFTYFNLVYYAQIKDAIKERIKKIHFRTAAHKEKIRRGCKLEKTYLFLKCHNRILNLLINQYLSPIIILSQFFNRIINPFIKLKLQLSKQAQV